MEKEGLEGINKYKRVNLCVYKIVNHKSMNPSILYLLNKNKETNKLYFPNFGKVENIEKAAIENLNIIFKDFSNNPIFKGYLELNENIYILYEIEFLYELNKLNYNNEWWWTTVYEIVNIRKLLNFEIDKSVYKFFYENSLLICLFDNNGNKIKTNNVAYFGQYYKYIMFCVELGLPRKLSDEQLGPFYYLTSYDFAGNYAVWDLLNKPKKIDNELITVDNNGKYKKGGLLRMEFSKEMIKYNLNEKEKLNDIYLDFNSFYKRSTNKYNVPNIKFILRDKNKIFPLTYHFVNTDQVGDGTKFFELKNYNIE